MFLTKTRSMDGMTMGEFPERQPGILFMGPKEHAYFLWPHGFHRFGPSIAGPSICAKDSKC
jgi:hypothetical protein